MAGELNSIQESIKLALDAADAATDVTSEYSQVKRESKKLERKVSQIHRYTTITFVSAVVAAVAGLSFSALLYFKTLSELRLMSTTNREGLVVFAENIEQLNSVLSELNVALDQQEELVALNRESSEKMTQLMTLISSTSEATINELQASTSAMRESQMQQSPGRLAKSYLTRQLARITVLRLNWRRLSQALVNLLIRSKRS